jgi:hypothetical protein
MNTTLQEKVSMEWVRRAGNYRTLVGKRDQLGFPLGEVESARLEELERFFTGSVDPQRAAFIQRDLKRAAIDLIVTFSAGQIGSGAGAARDISGDGMFVETPQPLPVGSHTVIRIIDRWSGDEWRFGAEVVRLEDAARAGMGLRFVGIPVYLRVGHRGAPPELPGHLRRAA